MARQWIRYAQIRRVDGADLPAGSPASGIDAGNLGIVNVAAPVAATDAANKAYVDALAGGGEITEDSHAALRQLVHFIDEGPAEQFISGAFRELLPAGDPFPTSAIWWESDAKTEKIVEQLVTYNSNKTVATSTWNIYDEDGSTVLATVVDTFSYSGVFEVSRTRTIS